MEMKRMYAVKDMYLMVGRFQVRMYVFFLRSLKPCGASSRKNGLPRRIT